MADASAFGRTGDEAKRLKATRQPLLATYQNDGTVVTLILLILQLLREYDFRPRQRRFWRLPTFGAFRPSMVALVHAYWACFIFQALAIVLSCALGFLTQGPLFSAIVAATSYFYMGYRSCVVNIDKDCRPKLDLHMRKAKSIESVLFEHEQKGLQDND